MPVGCEFYAGAWLLFVAIEHDGPPEFLWTSAIHSTPFGNRSPDLPRPPACVPSMPRFPRRGGMSELGDNVNIRKAAIRQQISYTAIIVA